MKIRTKPFSGPVSWATAVLLTTVYTGSAPGQGPVLIKGTHPQQKTETGSRWYNSKDPELLYRRIQILEGELKKNRQTILDLSNEVKNTRRESSKWNGRINNLVGQNQHLDRQLREARDQETALRRQIRDMDKSIRNSGIEALKEDYDRRSAHVAAGRG
ncbi:MAG: hypothetical protein AAF492_10235 [Verrucomicrobiota bacterium]